MISVKCPGDFKKTFNFLERIKEALGKSDLNKFGELGVRELAHATPVDSGRTADSWKYEIEHDDGRTVINWYNENVNDGVYIAVILQYGHGTGTGGYVQGKDYINPAMRDVFKKIADEAWEEVTRA